jgi:leucyl aminopeptidase
VNPPPLTTLFEAPAETIPLHLVAERDYAGWLSAQSSAHRLWLQRSAFRPEQGRWTLLPGADGEPSAVLVGTGRSFEAQPLFWLAAALADRLPPGAYALAAEFGDARDRMFATGWALGGYRFARYKPSTEATALPRLQLPQGVKGAEVSAAAAATAAARDLINTPANDMGPAELEAAALALAQRAGGTAQVIAGARLVAEFPLVAAVGQGSTRAPRLIELRFPRSNAPRVALVGKGVCFDTGGLDIKAAAGMLLMKKDMGGAACVLGLTEQLRLLDVPVDLRVLIPAVENAVDGNAFRPGDVWRSRKGLSVEITNTDAEGRLVLADALHAAAEEKPDLLIDFATLTGAARVALGPELPPVYGGDAGLVAELVQTSAAEADPLWPMPLWEGYEDELASRIADLNNSPSSGMAGSITAALFLRRFVQDPQRWLHLDVYGWNGKERAGRPAGAEAHGVRAVCAWLRRRYT